SVDRQTVVDLPTRHADGTGAERPPSWPLRGGSASVCGQAGRIGQRLRSSGADRPPSPSTDRRWSICLPDTPTEPGQSGHRLGHSGADRPSSAVKRGGSASACGQAGRIGHRLRRPTDGGRSAYPTRRRNRGRAATVLATPGRIDHRLRSSGADRPAPAVKRGGSATVSVDRQTVVDLPTRHADGTGAERPPSWPLRGGSTIV